MKLSITCVENRLAYYNALENAYFTKDNTSFVTLVAKAVEASLNLWY